MPGNARKDIVREGEIGTYHCWSRCVQRAFLCGKDRVTGLDFSYRRGWIESLLDYLAGVFAIDVGNYNVLTNHLHAILRTRPDLVAGWSDEQVAWRWKRAWPEFEFEEHRWKRDPTDQEIDALLANPEKMAMIRCRLSSLSWFMARWKEPIARMCNAEMKTKGHFWEARFGSRELLDQAAILTGSLYIDVNQLAAGMVDTLEGSEYAAIRHRILAARRSEACISQAAFFAEESAIDCELSLAETEALYRACCLSPITGDGPLLTADSLPPGSAKLILPTALQRELSTDQMGNQADEANAPDGHSTGDLLVSQVAASQNSEATALQDESPGDGTAAVSKPRREQRRQWERRRASDAPILDMRWEEYERVLREMVRMKFGRPAETAASGERPAIDPELDATLRGRGINPLAWLAEFEQLEWRCTRALGTAARMVERAAELSRRWIRGVGWCRQIFLSGDRGPPVDAAT